jgi:exodeoxyribonuclease-5
LFVVGDPKQAIYRFRGADVDTYLDAKRAILAQDPDAVLEIVANFRSLKQIIDFANDQFRGLLSPENGQPGFTALQPTRLPRDERPPVACFDVTIGDDHKSDKGKIVVDRVRREEARIVADLVSRLIGTSDRSPCGLAGPVTLRFSLPRARVCGFTSARWSGARFR